jgi:hypothetical protein
MTEPAVETGADGVQPVPRRHHRRHFDIIVSLSAIFISAVSLFVAIEHGKTERDLVAANSWPSLQQVSSTGYDDKGTIALGVYNAGIGPAKVKTFEMFYKGQPVNSPGDLLRRCCGVAPGPEALKAALPHGFSYSLVDETVLRPGDRNAVLKIFRSLEAPDVPNRLAAGIRDIGFRACYCSVLDECWISNLQTTRTDPVRECPAPAHRYIPYGK